MIITNGNPIFCVEVYTQISWLEELLFGVVVRSPDAAAIFAIIRQQEYKGKTCCYFRS